MGVQARTLVEQIADEIMNMIQKTPYRAGDKLPTEKELCEKTGAGRNTVREACKDPGVQKYIGNSTGGRDFCVRETGGC
ncbi:FadR/GntR family transcriptional regulator [Pilosibacter sp. HC1M1C21]|uniref:FadR/GntR family transcriptional regulator n=1 Tax=Pilosibacter sp. HC1M1C21 TaxID=3378803 RepID=UPI0038591690